MTLPAMQAGISRHRCSGFSRFSCHCEEQSRRSSFRSGPEASTHIADEAFAFDVCTARLRRAGSAALKSTNRESKKQTTYSESRGIRRSELICSAPDIRAAVILRPHFRQAIGFGCTVGRIRQTSRCLHRGVIHSLSTPRKSGGADAQLDKGPRIVCRREARVDSRSMPCDRAAFVIGADQARIIVVFCGRPGFGVGGGRRCK
jgi:hypothetical protein